MYIEYRVTNLRELTDTIQAIREAVQAVNGGGDLSEVLIGTPEFNCLDLCLRSEKLSDGSEVYNVEVPNLVSDVCMAGNSAVNGICGDPDCVCAR